ncbi:MAG: hypothetical protein UT17_C0004G0278 [Candidatus Woesebacteria bacterium GW2011_GWB1_39_10]|uniref:Uncharacterized protein n=2 Tax=Candidatus Woeseibacteriota TaxID=1752722 RepID=A0A0G0LVA0_9BACT|nr:MAG: hypothetical protein UT17_C0004G0278 [Candidatus Woesebacteria bacterium GW2011_GWB1_39_10]KKS90921.1 MAG: hypothetical protein UV66_C0001G0278 [Candidatus Woesebacteria bacterium GW2011_GWA1_43_12]
MEKRPRIIIAICLVLSIISIGYILSVKGKPQTGKTGYPLPLAIAKPPQEISVGSPDGNWTLTMKEEKNKETISYRFLISNNDDIFNKEIFAKILSSTDALSIPANTFSPDDKYVFLKETGLNGDAYFVLSVSGESISGNIQTLDISGLFAAKYQDYKITDVTGWGGVGLVVINTDKASGGVGPSFWFEVPSGVFVKLSNRLN